MAIKVYGNKIVFPDGTEQTTASTQLDGYDKTEMDAQQKEQDDKIQANTDAINAIPEAVDAYTKAEIDAQQNAQDTEINKKANTTDVDAKNVTQDAEIATKIGDAPKDGEQYVRKDGGWQELEEEGVGDVEEAPADGKTYGRKDEAWSEVTSDAYTEAETDALLDGKADKGDSYLKAEADTLLDAKADKDTTYTKVEVDASQSAQDTKIDKNKADIATNKTNISNNATAIASLTTSVVGNDNDIIELEQEIEALTPSFERGHWQHDPITGMAARAPIEGAYYLANEITQIISEFENTHQIYFNNVDSQDPAQTHTFDDVEEGMYIEMFEEVDSSYFLGVVETVTKGGTHTVIDVTMIKAKGGPTEDSKGVRVKIFSLAEVTLDLDGYMEKAGGTFTGDVIYNGATTDDNHLVTKKYVDDSAPAPVDTYTKDEIDEQQLTQDAEITANTADIATNTLAINDKADKDLVYTKTEVDASQATQDTEIAKKANQATTYTKTEVDDSQALQDTEIAKKANQATTYTKDEVDASQKVQDDAIAELQNQNAPWEPHDYLYVNNCVKSPEEGKHWEKFVAPKPGEVFFMGPGGMPLSDDNYQSIELIYISKYDKKGNELPFKYENIYNEETGELEFVMFDVNQKPLKFASPNGSATFMMFNLITSDVAPEHIDYEGETFYIITIDMYEEGYAYKGTITEGEIAQVTSPEEGQVIAEWEAKEYIHPEDSLYKISSANTETNQIVVNKLAIGSSYSRSEEAVTNIMIGNEPYTMKPWWAGDYLPGLHWNTKTSEGNIAVGHNSLMSAENVMQNVAVGSHSLQQLKNGWGNTAIGYEAGALLDNGNYNIFIGHGAGPKGGENDVSGQVVLGDGNAEELWVGGNKVFPFPDDLGGGSGGEASGGIEEAPTDGKQYGRQSERWSEIEAKMPEPRGMNMSPWGRKLTEYASSIYEWVRVKEAVPQWHNYKGDWYHKDPGAGVISIDNLFYSSTTTVKISTTEIPGTSVSATPMKDRLKALKVGDSIDVQTTHYFKNDNHVGGGALEITGITEHDTYFEFNVNSNDKYWGALEPNDGVAVLLPGEVAQETKDVYDYNLEVNGITVNGQGVFKSHIIGSEGLNLPNLSTASSSTTPLGITAEGWIYKTATTYSAEEVDKKLAIKDKLIEKLSARLDKLEKKLK